MLGVSGYTGEDGFEILSKAAVVDLTNSLWPLKMSKLSALLGFPQAGGRFVFMDMTLINRRPQSKRVNMGYSVSSKNWRRFSRS